jgi:hypothetical protein
MLEAMGDGTGEAQVGSVPRDFPPFRLNPTLDPDLLNLAFEKLRRVRIARFLAPECASVLEADLRARTDWCQIGGRGADADPVYGPRNCSGRRYEAIRVPDDQAGRGAADDPLAAFARFMSGAEARDFFRRVTGFDDVVYGDAEARAYAPGDFLAAGHEAPEDRNRRAACLLGLTAGWRAEWGGLLLFHDEDGLSVDGVVPQFNTLNLFAVPQLHSVSIVSPAARFRRHSITGWLRSC